MFNLFINFLHNQVRNRTESILNHCVNYTQTVCIWWTAFENFGISQDF